MFSDVLRATCSAVLLRRESLARRRWTVDLSADDQDISSPKWAKPKVRRASNRLVMEELEECDRSRLETLSSANEWKFSNAGKC